MLFEGRASNWALTKLEIVNLGIEVGGGDDDNDVSDDDILHHHHHYHHHDHDHDQGSFISDDLSVVSSHGYRIAAPKGLAWCCQQAGVIVIIIVIVIIS